MSWDIELDDQLLQDLYAWVDQIPLSRPKRRIERDFSDGVMVAELVKYYFPNWVELHNYTPANNTQQKMINWGLLNRKVFNRFGLNVPEHVMRGICVGKQGLVEMFLYNLRTKVDEQLYRKEKDKDLKPTPRNNDKIDDYYDYDQGSPKAPIVQSYADPAKTKAGNGLGTKPIGVAKQKQTVGQALNGEVVARLDFEEKEQECLAKDEQIQILNAKIRRLEHLLHLKDVRIQDLTEKMEASKPSRSVKK